MCHSCQLSSHNQVNLTIANPTIFKKLKILLWEGEVEGKGEVDGEGEGEGEG